tara:strand:- start:171 stop:314 length:144 start_codon:yes stop_codon:yes gene_type:complete
MRTDQLKLDPYLYAELIYYLKDMAKRGDDTARQLLDDLPLTHHFSRA